MATEKCPSCLQLSCCCMHPLSLAHFSRLSQCTRPHAKELRFKQLCNICRTVLSLVHSSTCHLSVARGMHAYLNMVLMPLFDRIKQPSSASKAAQYLHIPPVPNSCLSLCEGPTSGTGGAGSDSRPSSSTGLCHLSGCLLPAHRHDCHPDGGRLCIGPLPPL